MSAYVIVEVRMTDPDALEAFNEYASKATELLKEYGATVLVFDQAPRVLEGDWQPAAIVVQQYPDMAAVEQFYSSDAYGPLRALRARFSDNNVIAVGGTSG
ncbi:MAG: DUF1330 domain-containing protein [Sphingobium sp.]|uniref:DUF1330 domain-containing protein n=1 Tax=Sphingobium sp. TaxID=1912891 RepID=UPI000DB7920C|nr:DUF1330 domain-containing protein [Sphingobium sp.]PZU05716.1 MAG: DUF1330 domain-containing protein [Sphingobium sp.]PZU68112.1 MAG: DUF1330 domain-containing protein [Rhizobium sp.]